MASDGRGSEGFGFDRQRRTIDFAAIHAPIQPAGDTDTQDVDFKATTAFWPSSVTTWVR